MRKPSERKPRRGRRPVRPAWMVASLEYADAGTEPASAPFGEYGDEEACYVPLGRPDKTRNVTERILNWIECRNPAGC